MAQPHISHDFSELTFHCVACGCRYADQMTAPLPCKPSTDDSPEGIAELHEIDWLAINAGVSAR